MDEWTEALNKAKKTPKKNKKGRGKKVPKWIVAKAAKNLKNP